MNDLDDDSLFDAVRFHEIEQHLGGGVVFGRPGGFLGPGIFRILLPHVHVGIDDAILLRGAGRGRGERAQSGSPANGVAHMESI